MSSQPSGPTKPKRKRTKKKTPQQNQRGDASDARSKKWWKSIDDHVVDPITLTPIKFLSYEPFEINANGVQMLFDPRALADYVVSTGTSHCFCPHRIHQLTLAHMQAT